MDRHRPPHVLRPLQFVDLLLPDVPVEQALSRRPQQLSRPSGNLLIRSPRQPPAGGWPELGSVVSKLHGLAAPGMPAAVDLSIEMAHRPYNLPGAGFLGTAHAPFQPRGRTMEDMVLQGVSVDRLADRRALVTGLDRFRRAVDQQLAAGPGTFGMERVVAYCPGSSVGC